jgi:hypothetical protein
LSLFGYLAILAAVGVLGFGIFFYAHVKRLLARAPNPKGEEIGSVGIVLSKLRKGEPMSKDEIDFATQIIAECRSIMAYSIPAAIFALGCFYVFGNLELHGAHSLRIYIGLGPMLGAINVTARLLRIAALKKRLRNVHVSSN